MKYLILAIVAFALVSAGEFDFDEKVVDPQIIQRNMNLVSDNEVKHCPTRQSNTVFAQCDSQWGQDRMSGGKTLCAVGCLMSSVAASLNSHGITVYGHTTNPHWFNEYLVQEGGYQGNLFIWGSVARWNYDYRGQFSNTEAIKADVCNPKHQVILNVHNGGHWVWAVGVDGDYFLTNDSAGGKLNRYHVSEVGVSAVYWI